MTVLEGGCHCRNIRFAFATDLAPAELVPRACDCSFCRKHDARALSDPAGRLAIRVADESALARYRFGSRFTDFLICRNCGVYVGALMPDGDGGFANIMANALDDRGLVTRPPAVVHRSSEDAATKRARRRAQWTPATLTIAIRT
jgi:hypothetical protein